VITWPILDPPRTHLKHPLEEKPQLRTDRSLCAKRVPSSCGKSQGKEKKKKTMAPSANEPVTLAARCHCGLASYTVTVPTSSVPLKSAICSCTSCRRATGHLFATFVVVPGLPVPDVSALSSYTSSASLKRIFCPRCGCSVVNHEAGEWEFTGGALEGPVEGLLDRQALFANDSADGGGYIWLPKLNGTGNDIKYHGGHRDSDVVDVEALRRDFDTKQALERTSDRSDADEKVHVRCHCGAFECYITRPTPNDPGPTPGHGKWWLADDGRRYKAILDACKCCRKVTGVEINSWAYAPAINFTMPDGSPLDPASHPALKHYESSPGIQRDFCGTCGASVFFRKASRVPQVFDIAVGLLQGQGARAEDWLEWDGIEYEEFALDPQFVSGIAEAMRTQKPAA
jgi:hypothetical protein